MAHKVIDRCKETTSTTGTGSLTLTGAVTGFVAMADATAGLTTNGDTSWFCAENGAEWEVFLGTRTSSTVLARTTVLASSNAGASVSFTAAPTVFSTVPAARVATVGPAFLAYRATSNQAVTSNILTKIQFNAEEFDTDNCFDSTTNYRFTPNVAGYYRIEFAIDAGASSGLSAAYGNLQKNGVNIAFGAYSTPSGGIENIIVASRMVYMNGSTDYLELHANIAGTSPHVKFGAERTYFSGSFVRG